MTAREKPLAAADGLRNPTFSIANRLPGGVYFLAGAVALGVVLTESEMLP